MQHSIELRAHIGRRIGTHVPVTFAQDMVFVDNSHVGYIGHQPGAPLNLITRDLDDAVISLISDAIAEKFGTGPGPLSMPVEIRDLDQEDTWEEFEDDEDDDEDDEDDDEDAAE